MLHPVKISTSQASPLNHQPLSKFEEAPSRQSAIFDIKTEGGNLATLTSGCVRLDLEDLPCFTVVDRQYEAWGVLFNNAIAIRPSNPVYPPYSGLMVLLGAPNSGWLEATFVHPVHYVSSFITSSRSTVMSAFNRQSQLLARIESPSANLKNSSCSANLRLSLTATNIYRITLQSLNGQLTVDDFCFCGV